MFAVTACLQENATGCLGGLAACGCIKVCKCQFAYLFLRGLRLLNGVDIV
jgi:hypothetical protein